MAKSLTAQEIHAKYYANILAPYFVQIVEADTLTSNLSRGKVGMYAKWFLRLYQKENLQISDLETAKQYIAVFDRMSKANMLENKDINHYNSLQDLYLVVRPYLNAKIISKSEHTKAIKNSEAEKLYEDEQFLVVYPKTFAASVMYGRDSKWCTTSKRFTNDQFNYYNSKGKLYIVINKQKKVKYQFHFEENMFCDEKDIRLSINSLGAIKKMKPTEGLIDFFVNERQNNYLFDEKTGKLNIALNADWNSNNELHIVVYKKKYGIALGKSKFTYLLSFKYDLIKTQEFLPHLYETYMNGETDLCCFSDNQLFLNTIWYSEQRKKYVEYNMYRSRDLLFPYFIPTCKGDLDGIVKKMIKQFKQKYFTSIEHPQEKTKAGKQTKRNDIPNSIAANTLTIAILEYAYYGSSKSNEDYQTVINKCKNRISEYGKNEIPKIITRQKINGLDLFFVIDNKIRNGVFRLQYAEILDKKKLTN
jgi:hypothetical protein